MMDEVIIKAEPRSIIGKQVKALRREGKLPAVLYSKNIGSKPILLDAVDVTRTLRSVGTTSLVVIELEGKKHTTLVRERQRDFIKGSLLHVDFQEVSLKEKVRANVSIVLEGEAPAEKAVDGLVVTILDQLEVESLPQDLPERIVVDISSLENIGDGIHVKDIEASEDFEILTDMEELIVVITAPTIEVEVEEEVEEVVEEELEPEVVDRGKAVEEDQEAEEE